MPGGDRADLVYILSADRFTANGLQLRVLDPRAAE